MKVRRSLAMAVLGVAAAAGAVPAYADRVYQGGDYAEDFSGQSRLRACDREGDGNGVKGGARTTVGSSYEIKDPNGYGGVCGETARLGEIYRIRVCEIKAGPLPDDCSDWKTI